jgi:hypothetical protein
MYVAINKLHIMKEYPGSPGISIEWKINNGWNSWSVNNAFYI